ncbi:MAG: hypothetical protein ACYDBV_08665 [Nitrospiria bacterium]
MSYYQNEIYLEQEVSHAAKIVEAAIYDYYLNSGYDDGQLSDCISYEGFRDGVLFDLKPSHQVTDKQVQALDSALKGENKL